MQPRNELPIQEWQNPAAPPRTGSNPEHKNRIVVESYRESSQFESRANYGRSLAIHESSRWPNCPALALDHFRLLQQSPIGFYKRRFQPTLHQKNTRRILASWSFHADLQATALDAQQHTRQQLLKHSLNRR